MLTKKEYEQIKVCLHGVGQYRKHYGQELSGEECIPIRYLIQLLDSFTEKEEDKKKK